MAAGDALIGHTGFVGTALGTQHAFSHGFNSSNIFDIGQNRYDTVVCAAAPGSMFTANRFPDRDEAQIEALIEELDKIKCERFVLISSIAVLADFAGKDAEHTEAFQSELAYGRHRRHLEVFCKNRFVDHLIVRLPALYARGLRKNFLFDILNPVPTMLNERKFDQVQSILPNDMQSVMTFIYRWDQQTGTFAVDRQKLNASEHRGAIEAALLERDASAMQFTNPQSIYQYYGVDRLWADISAARENGLDTLHAATEPLRAAVIFERLTGKIMPQSGAHVHKEDMRTLFAEQISGHGGPYLEPASKVLEKLERFFAEQRNLR